jgi:hypothetical protein
MFASKDPACKNPTCRAVEKLSMSGYCSECSWALSQRHMLLGQQLENEMKADEIKHLNKCLKACEVTGKELVESSHINQAVLVEENVRLRANLIKAHHKLVALRTVK